MNAGIDSGKQLWTRWVDGLTFRVKLALLVNLLIVLLILGTALLVERRQRSAIIQEVEKRALVMAQALDSAVAAKCFGSACHVLEGMPVVAHIAQYATGYRAAIEENIRIGGDSCGRAIMLGAIMAAYTAQSGEQNSSIPLEWMARYRKLPAAADACSLCSL